MGDFKHLILATFKEGVVMEELVKEMEKMASDIHVVKSFQWGQDLVTKEALRQGFTHTFLFTFESSEDFHIYLGHQSHAEFAAIFTKARDKILAFDFQAVSVKPSAASGVTVS